MSDSEETEEDRLKRIIKESRRRLKDLEYGSYLVESAKAETLKRKRKPLVFQIPTLSGEGTVIMEAYDYVDRGNIEAALGLGLITRSEHDELIAFVDRLPWTNGYEE